MRHCPRATSFDTCVLQHAAAQECMSTASPNTFSPSEKEKIFNTKAMVTCKRSAAIVKNWRVSQKASRSCYKALLTCALRGCHGKPILPTVLTVSQALTKNKTFPLNHSLACANYAIYAVIRRVPTWGSAIPGRVEKCRLPSFRFIRERLFAIPSFHQKCRPGVWHPPPPTPLSGLWPYVHAWAM